jgi:glucose/mannose-6-phosphate isomerase
MLDDLKLIHTRDASDAFGVAEKQWQQLEAAYDMPELTRPFGNIVVAGMGGSALAALMSQSWPSYSVPFELCRSYNVPAFVCQDTLFIASSYSGNTEETLGALTQAEERGAQIVVIASGGKLADIAHERSYPLLLLPQVGQPRFAVFASYKAHLTLLMKAGIVHNLDEVTAAASLLKQASEAWAPTVSTHNNWAKQIALELMGKTQIIYAGPLLFPAAYKWKISLNENAKNLAWCSQLPEFNHNEFIGWTGHPVDKPYAIIDLRSKLELPQIQKRFELTARLLSGKRPDPIVIEVKGETIVEQLLWTIALGDFVSLYLAILNSVDPSPVELTEKFKKRLAES